MPAAKAVSISLPIKPYLKQFLTHSFGEALPLSNNHIISVYILVCLEGKRHTGYDAEQQKQTVAMFTERYTVLLPANKQFLNGIALSAHNVIYLNRVLDSFFDQQLYLHTESNRMKSPGKRYFGYHKCLRNFLEKYQIEEDLHINFEALVKREQRFKKNLKISETFTSNFVLST